MQKGSETTSKEKDGGHKNKIPIQLRTTVCGIE